MKWYLETCMVVTMMVCLKQCLDPIPLLPIRLTEERKTLNRKILLVFMICCQIRRIMSLASRDLLCHTLLDLLQEGVVHHEMLGTVNGEADNNGGKDNPVPVSARVMNTSQDIPEEMHSDSVGSKTIHNEGSMLGVMEDFIRIGQAMGYAMEGSVNDLATIIGQ
nr:hypothetical protein [Tanacetum cinerariifolium]